MSDHQKRGSSDDSSPPKTQRRPDNNDNNARPDSEQNSQETQSLASRIQKSASGLARNAFLPSTPSADAEHLLSDSSKAVPSSSSSALAAAERYRESTGLPSSSSRGQTGYGSTETFRSQPIAQSSGFELPGLTEDEFQNTYGDDLSESRDYTSKGKGKEIDSDNGSRLSSYRDGTSATTTLIPSDGDAVVSILTDKTFDPEFPPSANEPPEYLETELSPPQLTPAEIHMIESFRRQLPPDPEQNPDRSRQLNSLSLVPDIGSFLDTLPASTATPATSLRDSVLTSLPGAADWIAVEEKYHDEVWGYLQPTLEAAAKEIESSKDSPGSEEGPAVRRLKMILKHMQQ
ncbi:hypothetical protein BDV12DRAFT_162741 [Aspergillus spectabilis]